MCVPELSGFPSIRVALCFGYANVSSSLFSVGRLSSNLRKVVHLESAKKEAEDTLQRQSEQSKAALLAAETR